MQLTLNVFNEKTVEVLKENKQMGTVTISRLINIINGKSLKSGSRLNDRDRNEKEQSTMTVSNSWKILT